MKPLCFFTPRLAGRSDRTAWALLLMLPLMGGCRPDDGNAPSPKTTSQLRPPPRPVAPPAPSQPTKETPVVVQQLNRNLGLSDEDLQAELFTPEVLLSAGHQATCRLSVGDTFPDLPLTALDGQPTSLAAQLGQRLTIVVFWQAHQPMSIDQIRHLQNEFAQRYRAAGVAVVAINVGDTLEEIRGVLGGAEDQVIHLSDPTGQAFSQVATEMLPRTYLLRADRQVAWFDTEYSRSTRRELRNAIRFVLGKLDQQANTGSPALM